jgi:cytidylate kinase
MTRRGICIAIDGPAASGKGTLARMLAQRLNYRYIDTGAMYRVVGVLADREGLSLDADEAVGAFAETIVFSFRWKAEGLVVLGNGADLSVAIRTSDVGEFASRVSALPRVRAALLDAQRAMAAEGAVAMDGRDIGSVVLPAAELKVFLDADLDERAGRRYRELCAKGADAEFERIRSDIARRDARDSSRAAAPLIRLPDSFYVESTGLKAEAVLELVLAEAVRRGA